MVGIIPSQPLLLKGLRQSVQNPQDGQIQDHQADQISLSYQVGEFTSLEDLHGPVQLYPVQNPHADQILPIISWSNFLELQSLKSYIPSEIMDSKFSFCNFT